MEKKRDFEIIISTCEKFSDLWDANIFFINKNWSDRDTTTYLVTDKESNKLFNKIKVISAGDGTEITQRLAKVLTEVNSEFILFTLDDYFLTNPISDDKIQQAVDFMKCENIDYLRLYPASNHYLKKEGAMEAANGYYIRNIEKGDYKISLYPGIWRTDFMRKTVEKPMNAWQYEVSLTQMARDLEAKCAISNHNEFPFLDVIRKGKILRKAKRYFDKNPVYITERETMKFKDEFMLNFRTWLRHWLPDKLFRNLKKYMMKKGHTFYSKE